MSGLGSRVKEARLEMGLSQKALGDLVHVSQQNIWKIESGKSKATYTIGKLAEHLCVSVDWLLTGNAPKRPALEDQQLQSMIQQNPRQYAVTNRIVERLTQLEPRQLAAIESLLDAFGKHPET